MNYLETKILEKDNILILLPEDAKMSLFSPVFAVGLAIESLSKQVQIASKDLSKSYPFISGPKKISSELEGAGDLFISIDTNNNKVEELRYEKLEHEIRIHLSSPNKQLYKDSVNTRFSQTPYDLIVAFGADSKEDLGSFYKKNSEIFEDTEAIFIKKDNYADFVFNFLSSLNLEITRPLATNLLAGILSQTNNLNEITGSEIFKLVPQLIKLNADYHLISSILYKNKTAMDIKSSKLVLKHCEQTGPCSFLSKISYQELHKSGLSSNDLISAIIKPNGLTSKNDLIVIVEPPQEKIKSIGMIVAYISSKQQNIQKALSFPGNQISKNCVLSSIISPSLKDAGEKIINKLKA